MKQLRLRKTVSGLPRLLGAACLLLSAPCLVPSAVAEDKVFDGKGFDPNRQYASELPFEHIDPLTGNVLLTFTDLVLPGNAGFDLRIQRTYNAKIYKTLDSGGGFTVGEDSWAGLGWTLHMGRLIFAVGTSPFPGCTNCPIAVEMPDGRRSSFFPHLDGVATHLTTKEFWTYQHATSAPLTHVLRLPNGVVYRFEESTQPIVPLDGDGTLRALYVNQIVDPFGNSVRVFYRTGPLAHLIERIEQNLLGSPARVRTVTFDYTETIGGVTARSLTRMTYSPPGRPSIIWTYNQSRPSGLNVGYTMLDSVEPPEGAAWSYSYYLPSTATTRWTLSQVLTPNGGTVDYVYRRQAFQVGAAITYSPALESRTLSGRLPSGSEGAWGYSYQSSAAANVTTITAPCGFRTVHRFLGISATQPHAWKLGALESRTVENLSGTVWEEEVLTWQQSPRVSNRDEGAPGSGTTGTLLQRREIRRPGDATYTTTHTYDLTAFSAGRAANFADYGRPHTTTESGQLNRTVQRTFFYFPTTSYPGFSNYIVDKPDTERLNPAGENFTTDYDYRTTPSYQGFASAVTVNGITTSYSLDATGYPRSTTDENNHTTSYTYDWGVLKDTEKPLPSTNITQSIHPEGVVASQTRRGFTTTFEYDRLLRLTQRTPPPVSPASNPTVVTYDPQGQFVRTARGSSFVTENIDGFGRPANTINAVNVRTHMGYDACGRRTYESYPFEGNLGSGTDIGSTFQFDLLQRLTRRTNPGGTFATYAYNGGSVANGIDVVITDEKGHRTSQNWSAFGNPRDARLMGVTAAVGTTEANTTTYTYNGLGSLTGVTPPQGAGRTWIYYTASESGGSHGQLKQETHPESGTASYTYFPNGLVRTRTDALSVVTTYGYDDNNRLTTLDRPGTVNDTAIGYDDSDNRSSLVNGYVSSTFGYDGANRLRSRTDMIGGPTFATVYVPDGNDNVSRIDYHSGLSITYEYDFANRISAVYRTGSACPGGVNCFVRSVTYHASGGITSFVAGNGGTHTMTYDPQRYWVTSVNAGGHLVLGYQNYDGVGNVGDITDSRAGFNQHFDYDNLDRLTTANGVWGAGSFGYDLRGNRTSRVIGSASTTYVYDSATQRLTNAFGGGEDDSFFHDLNGNLASQNGRTYTYTPENMLERATVGSAITTYRYDGDNLRKIKEFNGSRRFFLHGLGNQLLSEWEEPCATAMPRRVKDNIYLGSRLVAWVEPAVPPVTVRFLTDTASVPETPSTSPVLVRLTTANGAPPGCPVTVTLTNSAGTAVGGLDIDLTPRIYTFADTTASGTDWPASLGLANDTLDEDDETYSIKLTSNQAAVASFDQVAVTIQDDDPTPTVGTDNQTIVEGNVPGTMTFPVRLSAVSGRTVTATFATRDVTAIAPGDYQAVPTTPLTFLPGTSSQGVTVPIVGDLLDEGTGVETFEVVVTPGQNVTGGGVWTGTIQDDDEATLSVSDCAALEGNVGTATCSFSVSLSTPTLQAVGVNYATAPAPSQGATAGTDYTSTTGGVTFPAETTALTQTVSVPILSDTANEENEAFRMLLSNPSGAPIANGEGYGAIIDDELAKYYAVAPCRVLDTRVPGPSAGPLPSGQARSFAVTGQCQVPAGAKAVMLNVTVVQETHGGGLRLFPKGLPLPTTSVINYAAGVARANNATVLLGARGQVTVRNDMSSPTGTTQVIVDVFGYYR